MSYFYTKVYTEGAITKIYRRATEILADEGGRELISEHAETEEQTLNLRINTIVDDENKAKDVRATVAVLRRLHTKLYRTIGIRINGPRSTVPANSRSLKAPQHKRMYQLSSEVPD